MLDQTRIKDQAPFDITRTSLTEAEEPILHPVPRRDRADKTDAIRRLLDSENIPYAGTGSLDDQTMGGESRSPDASEAGPIGTELSSLSIFVRDASERSLFTFIELEGYPILRITLDGKSRDLILNNDQVKLLLRQMTLWLTR